MEHLRILFERLEQNGLVVTPAKYQFGCTEIDFLGHHITEQGSIPPGQKIQAVREFPKPMNIKGLQEFVGMINLAITDFYHILPRYFLPCTKPLGKTVDLLKRSHGLMTWIVLP